MAGHDVFISHSSLDKAVADAVTHGLEAEGVRCWIAPRDVTPGADWQTSLLDAIAAAKATVLVFTGHANDSVHVRKEITAAFEAGSVVVPFRLEAVEPQGALRWHLTGVHWLDAVTPPLDANIRQLAVTLKRMLQAGAEAPTAAATAPPAPPAAAAPSPIRPAAVAPPPPAPGAVIAPPPARRSPPKWITPPPGAAAPSTRSNLPLMIGGGVAALAVVVALVAVALSGGGSTATQGGGSGVTGPLAVQGGTGSAPAGAPMTPAREEALAMLRSPIENGVVFVGETELSPGSQPLGAVGATTVTTHQLVTALGAHLAEVTLVDAAGCEGQPSIPVAKCLAPNTDPAPALQAAGIDADRPVVFFCQGPSCGWSRDMAQQAAAAGWRNVFWFRGGMDAWTAASGVTGEAQPLA